MSAVRSTWWDSWVATPEVVQAGAGAAGEGDVVDGLLAVHPGRVQLVLVALDGLRAAEAEGLVVGVGGGDVGGADVEVVQPGDLGAAVQVVALDEALGALDRRGRTRPGSRAGR